MNDIAEDDVIRAECCIIVNPLTHAKGRHFRSTYKINFLKPNMRFAICTFLAVVNIVEPLDCSALGQFLTYYMAAV